jgi:hypothetical protein
MEKFLAKVNAWHTSMHWQDFFLVHWLGLGTPQLIQQVVDGNAITKQSWCA